MDPWILIRTPEKLAMRDSRNLRHNTFVSRLVNTREKNDEAGLSYLWLQREGKRAEEEGLGAEWDAIANWNENERNAKFRAHSFSMQSCARDTTSSLVCSYARLKTMEVDAIFVYTVIVGYTN